MFHRNSIKNHKIESFTYANTAARTGATGLVESDVGKLCYQTDTGYYYRLIDESPVTWSDPIGAASGLIESFTYADEAERTGATLAAGDIGKIAYQEDTEEYYRLTDNSPLTWVALGGGGGGDVFIDNTIVTDVGYIQFTSIPQTHRHLRIEGILKGGSFGDVRMQVNGVTTATAYQWRYSKFDTTSVTHTSDNSDPSIKIGDAVGEGLYIVIDIPQYSRTLAEFADEYIQARSAFFRCHGSLDSPPAYEVLGSGCWGDGDATAEAVVTSIKIFNNYGSPSIREGTRLTLQLRGAL